MNETSKSRPTRERLAHFRDYLHGDGIDIGCGPDPLVIPDGTVRPWDVKDGDAQLLASVPDASLDFVYSSHCLEHMRDVGAALTNWVRVLKPGGAMFILVPDYTLYEHHRWPSKWNRDHKASFSMHLTRATVGRATHYHVWEDVVPTLEGAGAKFVGAAIEDDGYDYGAGPIDQTMGKALAQIRIIARRNADQSQGEDRE